MLLAEKISGVYVVRGVVGDLGGGCISRVINSKSR